MRTKPRTRDALAELVAEKGELHEARYLEHLRAAGREVVEIELPVGPDAFPQATVATVAAMRSSVELIYQATFAREGWRSRADFVVRVGEPSMLGSWSYEPYDTKLARTAKPAAAAAGLVWGRDRGFRGCRSWQKAQACWHRTLAGGCLDAGALDRSSLREDAVSRLGRCLDGRTLEFWLGALVCGGAGFVGAG
jgi:hypothetical protein